MPYADGRVFYDADSHIMETSNWLRDYADPALVEALPPLDLGGAGAVGDQLLARADERAKAGGVLDDDEAELMNRKGWDALGAFDPSQRSRALDLLGFDSQLVFSTFATTQFVGRKDDGLLYGGTRAHNRGMGEFCSNDDRLVGVGFVPLDDPEQAALAVDEALGFGCGSVMVPSAPPRTHSPTHPDLDPVWARLQDADVPLILHVGGGGRLIRPAFFENGKPMPTDILGGGESFRSKDFMAIHNPPEIFLACMALDGVFERFPGLRCGCIEQGALWVVPLLQRLDMAVAMFKRSEPLLRELPLAPSEYIRRQVRFTPYPHEDVGWLIEQAGEDLFMFSSDYPHPEGTRDPLGRFERSLEHATDSARTSFYSGNYADLMALPAPVAS